MWMHWRRTATSRSQRHPLTLAAPDNFDQPTNLRAEQPIGWLRRTCDTRGLECSSRSPRLKLPVLGAASRCPLYDGSSDTGPIQLFD